MDIFAFFWIGIELVLPVLNAFALELLIVGLFASKSMVDVVI